MKRRYHRPSAYAQRDRRWPGLRLAAKRRDNWQCVRCGSRNRLEVDHIEAVRYRRDLAFQLDNLQTLCASCHTHKTRIELGQSLPNPERDRWRKLLRGKNCT